MDRRVIGLCVLVGSTLGGFVPEVWGASAFGLVAVLGGALGALVGVWAGRRIGALIDY